MSETETSTRSSGSAFAGGGAVAAGRSLSAKLLVLTMGFVLLAEILIFIPTMAIYRVRWLEDKLDMSAAVASVLVDDEEYALSADAQEELLAAIGAMAVAVREDGMARLLVATEVPPQVDEHVLLDGSSPLRFIPEAVSTFLFGGDRILRVYGPVGESDKEFEVVLSDASLRTGMFGAARNVAIVALVISIMTASLVFVAINTMMVGPIRRMTRSMLTFSARPDDPARIIRPRPRSDEIGTAERELAGMQTELQRTLGEQRHLAELGLAVSKINHDMRNMLAAAQLMSDRLGAVDDPTVQSFLPKLMRALDRAVSYSEGVLAYGRTTEPAPSRRKLDLPQMADEVVDLVGLGPQDDIAYVNQVPAGFEVDADPDQLFRVLANLVRNAVQSMQADHDTAVVKRLTIAAERTGSVSRIRIEDTGPGLPRRARENLFAPFRGAARSGGTGLGLAVALELVRAHSGTLELLESSGGRTVFEISIPDRPIAINRARKRLDRKA